MRGPVLLGVVWLLALPAMPAAVWPWTVPLLVGLVATWPVTVWSSRTSLGRWARRLRLLLTPEEAQPAAVVRAYGRALLMPPGGARPVAHVPAGGLLQLAPQAGEGG